LKSLPTAAGQPGTASAFAPPQASLSLLDPLYTTPHPAATQQGSFEPSSIHTGRAVEVPKMKPPPSSLWHPPMHEGNPRGPSPAFVGASHAFKPSPARIPLSQPLDTHTPHTKPVQGFGSGFQPLTKTGPRQFSLLLPKVSKTRFRRCFFAARQNTPLCTTRSEGVRTQATSEAV
jgi:hypothetical protein